MSDAAPGSLEQRLMMREIADAIALALHVHEHNVDDPDRAHRDLKELLAKIGELVRAALAAEAGTIGAPSEAAIRAAWYAFGSTGCEEQDIERALRAAYAIDGLSGAAPSINRSDPYYSLGAKRPRSKP